MRIIPHMKKRLIPAVFLVLYSAILVKLLILKHVSLKLGFMTLNFASRSTGEANWVPFKTILPYLLGEKGGFIALFNLGGNIVLFVPIGFVVPFVLRNMTWTKTLALALASPLAIEVVQGVFQLGIVDIDDVILNGLGIIIGYGAYRHVSKRMRNRTRSQIGKVETTPAKNPAT
ncbi:MAG: hypothetical protein AMXMBFR84_19680 [Candidatus Hydrogenedentota bacterium]